MASVIVDKLNTSADSLESSLIPIRTLAETLGTAELWNAHEMLSQATARLRSAAVYIESHENKYGALKPERKDT